MRLRLLVPLLLAVPAAAGAQRPPRESLAVRIDSLARAAMAEERIPGLSVAVVRGPDTVTARGWGWADLEQQVPATAGTVYRIGSLTKQFTALAILQLADQGRLSLDDPLQRFVPSFPTPGRRITIRHLLTHTSGIPNYTAIGEAWTRRMRLDLPPDTLLALVRRRPPDFAPGERFHYSNTNYFLLGLILEKASGEPYARYIQEHIATPLGLARTTYCDTRRILPGRAQGYTQDTTGVVHAEFISMDLPYAAGALCSTVLDLVTWQRALWSDRLVQPGGYNTMSTPARLTNGNRTVYGFGLGIGDLGGHRMVQHSGGINGFASALITFPDDTLIIAVLANSEDANATRIGQRIARAALGIPEPVVRDLPLTAAERAAYEGTYQLRDVRLRIFARGDSLLGQASGQASFGLLAQGDHTFVATFDPDTRVVFAMDGAGHAQALSWTQGGVTSRAARIR